MEKHEVTFETWDEWVTEKIDRCLEDIGRKADLARMRADRILDRMVVTDVNHLGFEEALKRDRRHYG